MKQLISTRRRFVALIYILLEIVRYVYHAEYGIGNYRCRRCGHVCIMYNTYYTVICPRYYWSSALQTGTDTRKSQCTPTRNYALLPAIEKPSISIRLREYRGRDVVLRSLFNPPRRLRHRREMNEGSLPRNFSIIISQINSRFERRDAFAASKYKLHIYIYKSFLQIIFNWHPPWH